MVTRHSDKVLCVGSNPTAPTMNTFRTTYDWEYTVDFDGSADSWRYYDIRFRVGGEYIAHYGVYKLPDWWIWSYA